MTSPTPDFGAPAEPASGPAAPTPAPRGGDAVPTSQQPQPQPQQPEQSQRPPQAPAQPPQWAWAVPPPAPQWRETPPLEYHQLLRGARRYRWWKPLLLVVLATIYYLTLSVAFGLLVMLPYLAVSGVDPLASDALMDLSIPDTQNPMSMLLTLGSVALMLPAALLAMLSVGLTPSKRLWSVALRIRWRWIWRTLLPAVGSLLVMNALGIALSFVFEPGEAAEEFTPLPGLDMTAALWSIVIALLLVPLQATAEEVVYRGMFMQTLGAWLGGARGGNAIAAFLRGPWLPIAIPAIAFGFSHIYDVWGWISVVMLALVAGWLSVRTGGLEAAISLHVVNNVVAFVVMATGAGGDTKQTSDGGGPSSAIMALVGFGLYAWWVDRDFRRRDGVRTRIDLVEVAAAPVAPAMPLAPGTPMPPTPAPGASATDPGRHDA